MNPCPSGNHGHAETIAQALMLGEMTPDKQHEYANMLNEMLELLHEYADIQEEDSTIVPAEIPADVMRELAEHYTAGETLESLAARHPYSYRKIRTALIGAGIALRPPRIPLPPTPPGMVNAYGNGRSIRQLASTYRMSYNQTRNILIAEGVRLRRRGQP
ncbi:helix-turn-helix domain-containing protein [Amycolatopsis sp. CA-126428]|uniref:helix-turn-helix domain-containing protein n=1 Tax=Amycolatopsis sp. CA-126428 TaxID=2073158 RepID=UPI003F8D8DC0